MKSQVEDLAMLDPRRSHQVLHNEKQEHPREAYQCRYLGTKKVQIIPFISLLNIHIFQLKT